MSHGLGRIQYAIYESCASRYVVLSDSLRWQSIPEALTRQWGRKPTDYEIKAARRGAHQLADRDMIRLRHAHDPNQWGSTPLRQDLRRKTVIVAPAYATLNARRDGHTLDFAQIAMAYIEADARRSADPETPLLVGHDGLDA